MFNPNIVNLRLNRSLRHLNMRAGLFNLNKRINPMASPRVVTCTGGTFGRRFCLSTSMGVRDVGHVAARSNSTLIRVVFVGGRNRLRAGLIRCMLTTANHHPGASGLNLRGASLRLSTHNMPATSRCALRASRPAVFVTNSTDGRLPLLRRTTSRTHVTNSGTNEFPRVHTNLHHSGVSTIFSSPRVTVINRACGRVAAHLNAYNYFTANRISFRDRNHSQIVLHGGKVLRMCKRRKANHFLNTRVVKPGTRRLTRLLT